jgi:hypothetical protein
VRHWYPYRDRHASSPRNPSASVIGRKGGPTSGATPLADRSILAHAPVTALGCQRPRREMQRVPGRPRGIRHPARIGIGASADVLRRGNSLAGRAPVDRVPFRGSDPERSGAFRITADSPVQPALGRGSGRAGASRPRRAQAEASGPPWPEASGVKRKAD